MLAALFHYCFTTAQVCEKKDLVSDAGFGEDEQQTSEYQNELLILEKAAVGVV